MTVRRDSSACFSLSLAAALNRFESRSPLNLLTDDDEDATVLCCDAVLAEADSLTADRKVFVSPPLQPLTHLSFINLPENWLITLLICYKIVLWLFRFSRERFLFLKSDRYFVYIEGRVTEPEDLGETTGWVGRNRGLDE